MSTPFIAFDAATKFLDTMEPGGYFCFQLFDDTPAKRPEMAPNKIPIRVTR